MHEVSAKISGHLVMATDDQKPLVHGLVPELQRRGLFRTKYDGPTLHDTLGLLQPEG